MGSTGYSACGQHGSSAIHSEIKGNQWLIPERSGTIMAFRSYGRCTFWAPGILKWTVTPSVFLFPIIGPFLWKSGPYNSSMGPPSSESVCVFIHSHTASFAALTYWRRKLTLSNCDAFGDHEVNWVRLLSESLTGKASLPSFTFVVELSLDPPLLLSVFPQPLSQAGLELEREGLGCPPLFTPKSGADSQSLQLSRPSILATRKLPGCYLFSSNRSEFEGLSLFTFFRLKLVLWVEKDHMYASMDWHRKEKVWKVFKKKTFLFLRENR